MKVLLLLKFKCKVYDVVTLPKYCITSEKEKKRINGNYKGTILGRNAPSRNLSGKIKSGILTNTRNYNFCCFQILSWRAARSDVGVEDPV